MTRDISKFFGGQLPNEIDEWGFEEFCEEYPGDMANHRKVLNGFLNWCKRNRLVKQRPTFKIPKWIRRTRHVLTPDEVIRLVKEAKKDPVNYMFVTLGLMHGMRPGERTQLRKDDFSFDLRALSIRAETVKTKKGRIVALNSLCAPFYEKFFKTYNSPFVFPHKYDSTRHSTRGWYQHRWKKLLRDAGLVEDDRVTLKDITPHDLRATSEKFASKNPEATDVMREKTFGASAKIQNEIYITSFEADEIRSLSEAITSEEYGVAGLFIGVVSFALGFSFFGLALL